MKRGFLRSGGESTILSSREYDRGCIDDAPTSLSDTKARPPHPRSISLPPACAPPVLPSKDPARAREAPYEHQERFTKIACIPFGRANDGDFWDTLCVTPSYNRPLLCAHPGFHTSIADELTTFNCSSVEVIPISRKGLGLVAKRDIASGECFVRERPLLLLAHELPRSVVVGLDQIVSKYMTPSRKALYDRLHNCHARGPQKIDSLGISSTNALAVEWPAGSSEVYSCVCDLISRANHDCTRNTQADFNYDTFCLELTCIRPIKKGSEVTIHYVETLRPTEERRAELKDSWAFTCMCSSCDPSSPTHTESEGRRKILKSCFLKADAQANKDTSSAESLWTDAYIETILSLIDREKILDLRGYLLARVAIAEDIHRFQTGNHERAATLARRALEELEKIGMRERDKDTTTRMLAIID